MWFRRAFRRRKRGGTQKPFDETLLPPKTFLTVAESTEEGLLLIEYASRMAVKNRFITKILADKTPWFIEHSREDARAALELLAEESEADAKNIGALIQKLRNSSPGEEDSQGYSYNDIANMQHRQEVALEVAKRLRERSDDEAYLNEIVDTARRDAWREIAANIEHNLDVEYFPIDEEYERNRDERLNAFINEDLATLIASAHADNADPAQTSASTSESSRSTTNTTA